MSHSSTFLKTVLIWLLVFYRKSFHPFAWASSDHLPNLAEDPLHFSVVEESPTGTVVGLVPVSRGSFRISASPIVAGLFEYNATDSTLRTARRIDREEHSEGKLRFTLVSVDESPTDAATSNNMTVPIIINVHVDLLDLNDNSPVFSLNPQNISIPENSPVGGRFRLPSGPATDQDSGGNGTVQKYTLKTEDGYSTTSWTKNFKLVVHGKDLFVEKLVELDRETRDTYSLLLIAEDGGAPSRSGNSTIHISVIDINDNAPKFIFDDPSNSFNASLNVHDLALPLSFRNATTGHGHQVQLLTKLTAIDVDEGLNGRVKYRLLWDSSILTPHEKFTIDEDTGELFIVNGSSWAASDKEPFTTLQVEATDRGTPPLSTRLYLRLLARVSKEDRESDDFKIGFSRAKNGTLIVGEATTNSTLLEVVFLNGSDSTSDASLKLLSGNENGVFRWEAYGAYGLLRWNMNGTTNVGERYVLAVEAANARGKRLASVNLTIVVKYPPGYVVPVLSTSTPRRRQPHNGFADLFTIAPIYHSASAVNHTKKSLVDLVSINTSFSEDIKEDRNSDDSGFFNWRRPRVIVIYASIGIIFFILLVLIFLAAAFTTLKLYRKRKARRKLPRGFSHRMMVARLHATPSRANSVNTGTTTVDGVDEDGYYCTIVMVVSVIVVGRRR